MSSGGPSIGADRVVYRFDKPCVLIALDVEATKPRICPLVESKLAADALRHWLQSQPELFNLLQRALKLAYGENIDEWIAEFGDAGAE